MTRSWFDLLRETVRLQAERLWLKAQAFYIDHQEQQAVIRQRIAKLSLKR
jgi:hypothetical protein